MCLGLALLQHAMQREMMNAQLPLVIGCGYLQNARHLTGSMDSRPHGVLYGLPVNAIDHYLKDARDILRQNADTILPERCAEGGVGGGLEELVL